MAVAITSLSPVNLYTKTLDIAVVVTVVAAVGAVVVAAVVVAVVVAAAVAVVAVHKNLGHRTCKRTVMQMPS